MIETKSILEKKSVEDGTRVCVMRFTKPFHDYDEWIRELAPSPKLLDKSRSGKISWEEYKEQYLSEMEDQKTLIQELKNRSDAGEIITLLCWEKDDKHCHRRLLKELILGSD